jgi:hypothetical protein
MRYYYSKNPEPTISFKQYDIDGIDRGWTKSEAETLEKKGITVIRDYEMHSRFITGSVLQGRVSDFSNNIFKDSEWGSLVSKDKKHNFLVPDCLWQLTAIPLTPTICLYSKTENKYINLEDIKKINSFSIKNAQDYIFAKNFTHCPV